MAARRMSPSRNETPAPWGLPDLEYGTSPWRFNIAYDVDINRHLMISKEDEFGPQTLQLCR